MGIVDASQNSDAAKEYRIPSWRCVRMPILLGASSGRWWLPFSGGKLVRLLMGSYESDQTYLMANELHRGCVLFDVGAAVGYYTLLAAPLVGREGHVVSFEPDPKNAAYLRKHVSINGLTNVAVHQTAIGDRTGQAHFTCGTGTGTGHLAESGPATVSICKLDDMVGQIGLPTHIKIDVEGAELQVLQGARNTLVRAKPTLFLSTHGAAIHHACCRFLSELGYTFQRIASDPACDSEILCLPSQSQTASMPLQVRRAA